MALTLPPAASSLPFLEEHSLTMSEAFGSLSQALLLENPTKTHTKQESKKRGLRSQAGPELPMIWGWSRLSGQTGFIPRP